MTALLGALVLARPLLMAHYMPWYESKAVSGHWGWHWTMNHFDTEKRDVSGRPQHASRYMPEIGLYDSSDPDLLECHTLQMKLAGIDGVFIDWYGTKDMYDYALLNRNAEKMIGACTKAGLKFAIVMEDHVVPGLVKAGKSTPEDYAKSAMDWLESKWFKLPGYLKWQGRAVLLMFGPQYYKETELNDLFGSRAALFTLLGRKGPAVGAYGWPGPQVGFEKSWVELQAFYDRAKAWSVSVGVAYPRFEDIYKEASVGPGYGEIGDDGGKTFRRTLAMAEKSKSPFVQIATWNDWGEGTQVEPSIEFGYRDLEELQKVRKQLDPSFPYKASDLHLPAKLYRLRKEGKPARDLNRASIKLFAGECLPAAIYLGRAAKQ